MNTSFMRSLLAILAFCMIATTLQAQNITSLEWWPSPGNWMTGTKIRDVVLTGDSITINAGDSINIRAVLDNSTGIGGAPAGNHPTLPAESTAARVHFYIGTVDAAGKIQGEGFPPFMAGGDDAAGGAVNGELTTADNPGKWQYGVPFTFIAVARSANDDLPASEIMRVTVTLTINQAGATPTPTATPTATPTPTPTPGPGGLPAGLSEAFFKNNTPETTDDGTGSTVYDAGTDSFVMTGFGYDFWAGADSGYFLHREITSATDGDLIFRVTDMEPFLHVFAKGFLAVRDSLDDGSSFYGLGVREFSDLSPAADTDIGYAMARVPGETNPAVCRQVTLSTPTTALQAPIITPHWFKLTKTGNTLKAFASEDGTTWEALVYTNSINQPTPGPAANWVQGEPVEWDMSLMTYPVYVGVMLTSHDNNDTAPNPVGNVPINLHFDSLTLLDWTSAGTGGPAIPTPTPLPGVPNYYAPATSTAPTLDGVASPGEWAVASPVSPDIYITGDGNTLISALPASDLSAQFRLMHDAQFLYLLVEVTDDIKGVDPNPTAQWWTHDSLEVFIDADLTRSVNSKPAPGGQYGLTYGGTPWGAAWNVPTFGETGDWWGASAVNATGYTQEFRFRYSGLGNIGPGSIIGFDLQIDDDDQTVTPVRDNQLAWVSILDGAANQKPEPSTSESKWGTVILVPNQGPVVNPVGEWMIYN
jgi:hypothetical protein